MSNDSPPQHPPPHPSHRCQTDVAQGQLDTPTSELQELLTLAKELLEQDSTEEYCEGQTSDSLPDATQHQTPPREEHPLKPVDTPEAARQRWIEQRAHMPNSETSTNTTQASSSRCRHKSKVTPQTSDFCESLTQLFHTTDTTDSLLANNINNHLTRTNSLQDDSRHCLDTCCTYSRIRTLLQLTSPQPLLEATNSPRATTVTQP
ncbi:hypothetical protein G5714_002529 [Onychostoma macrolepis]|uniref:Uncharacterized protein n=1 Tax=Onychostoma macrolepis TaxID=369639 RepID=A0A7J6D708_9TELE|nr:hypothetical protein G5714_002529 [Onychostoma macrolepis]